MVGGPANGPDHGPNAPGAATDLVDALADELLERETATCRPPAGAPADLAPRRRPRPRGADERRPGEAGPQLRAHGLGDHFDCVGTSYEVGAHGPDPAPFRAVEERPPADAYAIVGDDDAGVEGARDAGWAAHRYDYGEFGDRPAAIGCG